MSREHVMLREGFPGADKSAVPAEEVQEEEPTIEGGDDTVPAPTNPDEETDPIPQPTACNPCIATETPSTVYTKSDYIGIERAVAMPREETYEEEGYETVYVTQPVQVTRERTFKVPKVNMGATNLVEEEQTIDIDVYKPRKNSDPVYEWRERQVKTPIYEYEDVQVGAWVNVVKMKAIPEKYMDQEEVTETIDFTDPDCVKQYKDAAANAQP